MDSHTQPVVPKAYAELVKACDSFISNQTLLRAGVLRDLICNKFDSNNIDDIDNALCSKMYNAISSLLEYYKGELPKGESEKLFKARVALCDRAVGVYKDDVVLARKHWIDELDDLSNNETSFDKISGYDNQIKHCLEMFRASFTNSDSTLMISLPTLAMLRHATGGGEHERSERMTAAMRGVSTHTEGIKFVDASDVSDADCNAMTSLLEHAAKLEKQMPKSKYDVVDPNKATEDTYVNKYSQQAVDDSIKNIIKATREAIQSQNNGLCIIRPPGHHASSESAEGFCLRNNVIYGAHAAKEVLAEGKGVLIVDIDIHSGNGTIDYVKKWNDDHHSIQFVEIYNPAIYPCDPMDKHAEEHSSLHRIKIESGKKSGNFEDQLVHAIFEKIKLADNNTGIVFISLGLDGHEYDSKVGKCNLTDRFYILLFEKLNSYFSEKQIPVVAILEGGYQLSVIQKLIGEYVKEFHAVAPSPMEVVDTSAASASESDSVKRMPSAHNSSRSVLFAATTAVGRSSRRVRSGAVGKTTERPQKKL